MYTIITSKKNNPKKLYKLINHLTGNITQNRLPDSNSDNELANRFAKYFTDKIDKISKTFEREYHPTNHQSETTYQASPNLKK